MNVIWIYDGAHTQHTSIMAITTTTTTTTTTISRASCGLMGTTERTNEGVGRDSGAGGNDGLQAHTTVLLDRDRQQYEVAL